MIVKLSAQMASKALKWMNFVCNPVVVRS